jgi:Flp pilus assembly protein TadG
MYLNSHMILLMRRLAADRRGVTAIVTGIALTVLMGFAGLAVDVAAWLNATRGMQAAADQAAYSAALAAGTSSCNSTTATTQARAVAAARGYTDGLNDTTVAIACDSSASTFTVTVSQVQPLWFTRLFLANPPTATAQATAKLAGKASDLCILALDGTNVAQGITGADANATWLNGNTGVILRCGLAVDSSNAAALSVGGSSVLVATSIYLVGDHQGSPSGSSSMSTSPTANNILKNQLPVADPYLNRTFALPKSSCDFTAREVTSSGNTTLNPGIYCNGLQLGSTGQGRNIHITLNPGVYYIVGGMLDIRANADVTGTGVTFVLTGNALGQTGYATVTVNGGADFSLTAPTSGPFGGMAFFADRNAPFSGSSSSNSSCGTGGSMQIHINGGSNQVITGALYFPNHSVCYNGNSATTGAGQCTQLIARTISFTGNSDVRLSCTGTGVSPIAVTVPQLVK